jgi:hypothetical protein
MSVALVSTLALASPRWQEVLRCSCPARWSTSLLDRAYGSATGANTSLRACRELGGSSRWTFDLPGDTALSAVGLSARRPEKYRELISVVAPELPVDAAEVVLHGLGAKEESRSGLTRGIARGE